MVMNAGWKASHRRVFGKASSFKTQVVDGLSTRDYDNLRNRSALRPEQRKQGETLSLGSVAYPCHPFSPDTNRTLLLPRYQDLLPLV